MKDYVVSLMLLVPLCLCLGALVNELSDQEPVRTVIHARDIGRAAQHCQAVMPSTQVDQITVTGSQLTVLCTGGKAITYEAGQ